MKIQISLLITTVILITGCEDKIYETFMASI